MKKQNATRNLFDLVEGLKIPIKESMDERSFTQHSSILGVLSDFDVLPNGQLRQIACSRSEKSACKFRFDYKNLRRNDREAELLLEKQKQSTIRFINSEPVSDSKNAFEPSSKKSKSCENVYTPRKKCQMCSILSLEHKTKSISIESDKRLFIIASELCGYSIDKEEFMRQRQLSVCHSHFEDVLIGIFNALHIRNLSEIDSCSMEFVKEFMKTVNKLFPQIEFQQIVIDIGNFSKRNRKLMKEIGNSPEKEFIEQEKRERYRSRCKVCGILSERKYLEQISLIEDKQLIMMSRSLRGNVMNDEFLKEKKTRLVCHSHIEEILDDIFDVLHISNLSELRLCSLLSIEKLMETIDFLFPRLTSQQFVNNVHEFANRYRGVIRPDLIDPPKQSHLKLKPISDYEDNTESLIKRTHKSCKVCSIEIYEHNMEMIKTEEEKQLIIIGRLLSGNIMDNREFLGETFNPYICQSHFEETFAKIQSALHIKNLSELDICSLELNEFMKYVNSFFPQLSAVQFIINFQEFEYRNRHLINRLEQSNAVIPETEESTSFSEIPANRKLRTRNSRATCKVCFRLTRRSQIKNVTLKEEKQLIMIGCVLNGSFTMNQEFVNDQRKKVICQVHLVEVLMEIYKIFHIEMPSDLLSSQLEMREKLMKTVNSIFPAMLFEEFYEIFNGFLKRNQEMIVKINTWTDNPYDYDKRILGVKCFIRKLSIA